MHFRLFEFNLHWNMIKIVNRGGALKNDNQNVSNNNYICIKIILVTKEKVLEE